MRSRSTFQISFRKLTNVVGSKRLQSERVFVLFAKFNVSEFGEFNIEPFFLSGSLFVK